MGFDFQAELGFLRAALVNQSDFASSASNSSESVDGWRANLRRRKKPLWEEGRRGRLPRQRGELQTALQTTDLGPSKKMFWLVLATFQAIL